MSSLFSPVLACHELSFVSSSSVIRFAVSSGVEVNKDTTSKDIIISSGSIFISLTLVRKELTFWTQTTYQPLDTDPSKTTMNNINKKLKRLKDQDKLSETT